VTNLITGRSHVPSQSRDCPSSINAKLSSSYDVRHTELESLPKA
jgi:hypothetical protein